VDCGVFAAWSFEDASPSRLSHRSEFLCPAPLLLLLCASIFFVVVPYRVGWLATGFRFSGRPPTRPGPKGCGALGRSRREPRPTEAEAEHTSPRLMMSSWDVGDWIVFGSSARHRLRSFGARVYSSCGGRGGTSLRELGGGGGAWHSIGSEAFHGRRGGRRSGFFRQPYAVDV
jgi:hypothetical protein